MRPGRRGRTTGGASLFAVLAFGAAAFAQAQTVPPGLRPSPAPPDALRPPNFIAIPIAPEPPVPAPPAPVAQPAADADDAAPLGLPIRRAVIHHLGGTAVVDALRAAGYLRRLADTVELRVVPDVPALPSIRYFYEEDAGAAQVTAIALEGSGRFQVRGFPEYRPRPRPGLIEVWMPAP